MKTFRVDINMRESLASFPNNRSIHVWIYKLELARSFRDVEYLNIRHEQFVEQMHIGIAEICKILVPEMVNSRFSGLEGKTYLSRFVVFALIRARHLSI